MCYCVCICTRYHDHRAMLFSQLGNPHLDHILSTTILHCKLQTSSHQNKPKFAFRQSAIQSFSLNHSFILEWNFKTRIFFNIFFFGKLFPDKARRSFASQSTLPSCHDSLRLCFASTSQIRISLTQDRHSKQPIFHVKLNKIEKEVMKTRRMKITKAPNLSETSK